MDLTLREAAVRLGKSERQIRYLIQQGRLRAEKRDGRWAIASDDLPRNEAQQSGQARRERRLRAAVEAALELPADGLERRYSVRDLKAFQIALPVFTTAHDALGGNHPATAALHRVLVQLAAGCHRFDRRTKAEAYSDARDAASLAVCELILDASETALGLAERIEQDLMGAFAALLRRMERDRGR